MSMFILKKIQCSYNLQEKVFGVWLKLYKMRYAIAEKRMKVERIKQKVKFLEILCPQIELLNEWEKLEKRNGEAVARVTRKLSAYSTKLPLVDGAVVRFFLSLLIKTTTNTTSATTTFLH